MKTYNHYRLVMRLILFLVISYLSISVSTGQISLSVAPADQVCLGDGELCFTVTGQNANSIITYDIDDTSTPFNPDISNTTLSCINLDPGVYNVIAKETLNGQLLSTDIVNNVTINDLYIPIDFSLSVTDEICNNDGTITVDIISGDIVSVQIISGPGAPLSPNVSNVFENLSNGPYSIELTNSCGDKENQPIEVGAQNPVIVLRNVTPAKTYTFCDSVELSIDINLADIMFPINLEIEVYNPAGGSELFKQNILAGDDIDNILAVIPYFIGQDYTYDLNFTDACGYSNSFLGRSFSGDLKSSSFVDNLECGEGAIQICPSHYMDNFTINFITSPAGFVASSYNSSYPGPFTSGASFGSFANSILEGQYIFEISTDCGQTVRDTIEFISDIEPMSIVHDVAYHCTNDLGSIRFVNLSNTWNTIRRLSSPNGPIINGIANDGNVNGGQIYQNEDLLPGQHIYEFVDVCGQTLKDTIEILVADYGATIVSNGCGCFTVNTYSNIPNEFGIIGQAVTNGPLPENGSESRCGIGTAYVIQNRKSYTGSSNFNNSGCGGAIQTITSYNSGGNSLEFNGAYGFSCGGGLYDVAIDAVGNGIEYSITEKDGLPFIVDNGTDPVFTSLTPGLYNFVIEDDCGFVLNRKLSVFFVYPPVIFPENICDGENGSLSIQGLDYLDFKWYETSDPSTILSTENSLQFTPFESINDAGTYNVDISYSSPNSCINETLSFIIPDGDTDANAGDDGQVERCSEEGPINLFDVLQGTYDNYGDWTDLNATGNLQGSVFYPSGLANGTYQFEYVVPGICSGMDTSIATIVLNDISSNPPTCQTQDTTIILDATGMTSFIAADIDGGSSVECGPVTLSATPTSFDCSQIGANIVMLTVMDDSGNSSTCSATVTVVDTIAPTCITQDVTVNLDDMGMASLVAADVDGGSFDNCGPITLGIDDDSFACGDIGPDNMVTLTVTDHSGNTSQCTANVTVQDTLAPMCPSGVDIVVQLEAGQCDTLLTVDLPAATDNCDPNPIANILTQLGTGTSSSNDCPIDILFVMDNSGSINATEYNQMEASALAEKDLIASAFPNSRFATVHYFGDCGEELHIENDFTAASNITSIDRQGGVISKFSDDLNIALGLVANALDGVANPDLFGGFLNKDPNSKFCVVLFTDAPGLMSSSCTNTALLPYDNRNMLEADYGANFTVVHFEPGGSEAEAAAIASVGGTWTGAVENNPGDPDNGMIPRQFIPASFGTPSLDILSAIPPCTNNQAVFPIGSTSIDYLVEDASGNTDTCSFNIEILEYEPDGLACIEEINLSLDPVSCAAELNADAIVGDQVVGCLDSCTVMIKHPDGSRTSAIFDYSDVGKSYEYEVCCGGVCCWGVVNVEYKYVPTITCIADTLTQSCAVAATPVPPAVEYNCSGASIQLVGEIQTDVECHPDYTAQLVRTWQVFDRDGNAVGAACDQVILLERLDISAIDWPDHRMLATNNPLDCSYPSIDPSVTGVPVVSIVKDSFFGALYPHTLSELCNTYVTYTDRDLGSTHCVHKIMRTWTVGEWHCSNPEPVTYAQVIEIVDTTGPELTAVPLDYTVTTGTLSCDAVVQLPLPSLSDDCNADQAYIDISTPVGFLPRYDGELVTLPVGIHDIVYSAYDGCGNRTDDTVTVTVVDEASPIAVCERSTQVGLTLSADTWIDASVLDDGSFDECGPVDLQVLRMEPVCNVADTLYADSIRFCCADVGTIQMVQLLVTDLSGNTNQCMVEVEIVDKIPPAITCPADTTVACTYAYDEDRLPDFFGAVQIVGNCADGYTLEDELLGDLGNCRVGDLARRITVYDAGGTAIHTCEQIITFTALSPLREQDIDWPDHYTLTGGCDSSALQVDNLPDRYREPDIALVSCSQAGYAYQDYPFTLSGNGNNPDTTACIKIIRRWTVIDWCSVQSNGNYTQFVYDQILKLENTIAPTFTSSDTAIAICSYDINCGPASVELVAVATDDCTAADQLVYSYHIDVDNDGDTSNDIVGASADASDVYPVGTHSITWQVLDRCGNVATQERLFTVANCKAPTAYCQGIVTPLIPWDLDQDGVVEVKMAKLTPDLIDAGSMGVCSSSERLSFSYYPDSTFAGNGYDTLRLFSCEDVGDNEVDLYVIDELGNFSVCTATVRILNTDTLLGLCDTIVLSPRVSGIIHTEAQVMLDDVRVSLQSSGEVQEVTTAAGEYAFADVLADSDYVVTPEDDEDHDEGVSTLDLVLIQRHILGIQTLSSPYQMIAADINADQRISGADVVELRQLILGVTDRYVANDSWRFVDADYAFPSPTEPWYETFPEDYSITAFDQDMEIDFIGCKIGDVNGSYNGLSDDEDVEQRSYALDLLIADKYMTRGEEVTVPIMLSEATILYGWEYSWAVQGLKNVRVLPGSAPISGSQWMYSDGSLDFSYDAPEGLSIAGGETIYSLSVTATRDGYLSDMISIDAEGDLAGEVYVGDALHQSRIDLRWIRSEGGGSSFVVEQNKPNPWVEATHIDFTIPSAGEVQLRITDVAGRQVHRQSDIYPDGASTINLDRSDCPASGILFYEVVYKDEVRNGRMILMD